MVGHTFSHYHVLGRLGEGATATVYKAEDLALGRAVALKFFAKDISISNAGSIRFEHEARTASSLNHPNICTIYEIGEHELCKFLAMELLDGRTLTEILAAGPLGVDRLVELGIQIADALDAAHAEQIVHRDIKPANIFVSSRDHVKILDFGVAVLVPRTAGNQGPCVPARSGGVAGTIPYMSPEQLRGEEVDPRSDLFALGAVLYEMAAGRRPFSGRTGAEQMEAILNGAPPAVGETRPGFPAELDRIINKALEPDRRLRFQSASDLRTDLQRLKRDISARTITSGVHTPVRVIPPEGALVIPMPGGRARRWLMGTAGGAAVVGVVALGAIVTALNRAPEADPAPVPAAPPPLSNQQPARDADRPASSSGSAAPAPVPAKLSARQELNLARSEVALKLYDQALVTLRELISKDEDSAVTADAYFLIGSIQQTQGKVEDAMALYLEIAHRYRGRPRAAEALFQLGQVTLQSKRAGKESDATKVFHDLASQYPKSPWAVRGLMAKGELEERRQSSEYDSKVGATVPSALVTYRQVTTQYAGHPESETAFWKLGQLYVRAKRYDLAARTFRDLAMRYPATQYDAWFSAAELYDRRLKDAAAARAAYARVPPKSSRFDEARKRLQGSIVRKQAEPLA